ncbi:uncharacterized protein LOC144563540 [Carex rostrata]
MMEQAALAAPSDHVARKTDKPLSVKLSDKASCDSNVKLSDKATWSPTTPFELDFSYLDINSPKSPYTQEEQNLKTELGSTELDFSYLSINTPKSRISDEKYNSKSGLEQGNSHRKHVHSQAEFRIDIPNVAPQNEIECHRFYEEWVSPFSNGEETSSSETLASSIYITHMEKLEPLTTYVFGDQNPEMCSNLSHLGSSNISDLLELCRSSSSLGGCGLCNVELVEDRDIFIYMDKPFCSEECRDIFIEGESGYETMVDEEEVPVAKLHKHDGPIFLPINE